MAIQKYKTAGVPEIANANLMRNANKGTPSGMLPEEEEGGREYSQKNRVRAHSSLPTIVTLFMTKICDFPYPIYDQTKHSMFSVMRTAAGTVALNIIYEGLLLTFFSRIMER